MKKKDQQAQDAANARFREEAESLYTIYHVVDRVGLIIFDACQQPGGVITVATRHEGERVAVSIRDSGVGIKPEKMGLIFQPFYTTKPDAKGTGLGLPVCYGIVKEHGGEIEVQSQPGEGEICTVWLPLPGMRSLKSWLKNFMSKPGQKDGLSS